MKSIYEEFGCTTKEELYQKIKTNDESVRQLKAFIEFSKANYKDKRTSLLNKELVVQYISNFSPVKKNETKILFLDTMKKPIYLGSYNSSNNKILLDLLKQGLNAGASDCYIIKDHNNLKNDNIDDMLKYFGLGVFSTISQISDNKYYFSEEKITYGIDKKDNCIINKSPLHSINSLYDYDEFMQYYAKKEIQGLNIFKDIIKIKQILKVGYQDMDREIMGIINIDKNGNVTDIKNAFIQSSDSVEIDLKIICKNILNSKDIKGIIYFHNHPNGNSMPSDEDIKATGILKNNSIFLNVDLIDNLIIAKNNVFSMKEFFPIYFDNKLKHIQKPLFTFSNDNIENIKDIQLLIKSVSNETKVSEDNVRNLIDKNAELKMFEDNNIKYTFNVEDYAIRKYTDNQEEIYKKYSSIGNFIEKDGDLELDM